MSSILKALRKVEDEKACMGEGAVDLGHDILRRSYEQPRGKNWPIWLLVALFLLVAVVGLGWWLSTSSFDLGAQREVETQLSRNAVHPPTGTVPSQDEVALSAKTAQKGRAQPDKPQAIPELPQIQVEEIIYQQDPAARLAVINGLPVMVGTAIDGARIEEILPDAVILNYRGKRYVTSPQQ